MNLKVALGPDLYYIDIAVVHPTACSYLYRSCQRKLAAAKTEARLKHRTYKDRAERENATFVPFVLETFGGFCTEARDFVKTLGGYTDRGSNVWSDGEIRNLARRKIHNELFLGNFRLANTEFAKCYQDPHAPAP